MELRIHPLTLRLARPFTISRGTLTEQQTLIASCVTVGERLRRGNAE